VAASPVTAIIGAGISGLTCAYALKKSGQNVLLLEASPRAGGVIQSVEENGYLFELGPQSFSATSALAELCDELRLTEQVLEAPHGAPRYILVDRKLVNVALSPALLMSGLLNWGTKLSFLRDALGKTSPPQTDESIAAFVRRKFSAQFLDRLVGPFVSGIYAGDPEQLSLRAAFPKLYGAEKAAGSVIRGSFKLNAKTGRPTATRLKTRPGLFSFRVGNETLVSALATALGPALRCGVEVSDVRSVGNKFQIRTRSAAGSEEMSCGRVVVATPTGASAQILRGVVPAASAALDKISYAPVALVSLAYKQEQVAQTLNGFGFLAPRSSGLRTLGSVWNSSLFSARAPDGYALLTNFVGGATDPSATNLSEDELVSLVHREISPILKITGVPEKVRTTRYSHAIPQYNLGHLDRLQEIQDSIAQVPGLRLIGNYWKGPAIGACVEQALAVADEIRIL
jgi:oxygen-dependent protoporphyrinogen oxidase